MSAILALDEITEQLIINKANGVGHITLNQPEKLNAISYDMWVGLGSAMTHFEQDDEVRLIVLDGAGGKAFAAGADISQFGEKRDSPEAVAIYNAATKAAYDAVTGSAKPTLARITGYCIGGGMHLALCCDLRIASDDSKFGIPAARLGLGYGLDAIRPLTALVGPSRAKEILYTAKRFDAEQAQRMGLINQYTTRDEIDALVDDYVRTIAGNAPLTIRAAKYIVGECLRDPDARDLDRCQALVDDCFNSADYKEGRTAFMEKRPPRFTGK